MPMPSTDFAVQVRSQKLRLGYYALLSLATTGFGVYLMFEILRANDLKPLEAIILLLFAISFGWISMAFWSAFFGFVLQLLNLDPISLKRLKSCSSQTPLKEPVAVIMPVYNEDTERVIAGFEATMQSIMATGFGDAFDFYILSDTTSPAIALAERQAFAALQARSGTIARLYYRRRHKNSGRKVGNIRDFCERFGGHYTAMVVLDADSIMTGDCILTMARTLEANPQVALVQTVPIPVRQTTFFGRFVQYAAALYSPMLATGITYWQTDACNYWGHNAIIRMQAFINHCGLPTLAGKAPFGGDILSHDFVEAALLRRAGWEVWLLPNLGGSYEEVPCNLIDFAKRDRRWVQGNMQHLGLLKTPGLHAVSLVHFISGALAYMTSLVWLVMLALSSLDAIIRALHANVYFTTQYQLFPDWPIAKTGLITTMVCLTLILLLGPKIMGVTVALCRKRQAFGGAWALTKGALAEAVFAVLIAPVMMCYHAMFVLAVLLGFKVNWDAQEREGRLLPWSEVLSRTGRMAFAASVWGGVVCYYTPAFFLWVLPIVLGLCLAPIIVRYSSSLSLGNKAAKNGIFITPTEAEPVAVLVALRTQLAQPTANTHPDPLPEVWLPPEAPRHMPHPALSQYSRRQPLPQHNNTAQAKNA